MACKNEKRHRSGAFDCYNRGELLDIGAALLAITLTCQSFLSPSLLAGLQIEGVTLYLLDDVFLLHLALEAA